MLHFYNHSQGNIYICKLRAVYPNVKYLAITAQGCSTHTKGFSGKLNCSGVSDCHQVPSLTTPTIPCMLSQGSRAISTH